MNFAEWLKSHPFYHEPIVTEHQFISTIPWPLGDADANARLALHHWFQGKFEQASVYLKAAQLAKDRPALLGDKAGWWDVSARDEWTCPECLETLPVEEWEECEPYCKVCGSHDGRRCPRCKKTFDHVWGAKDIESASEHADDYSEIDEC